MTRSMIRKGLLFLFPLVLVVALLVYVLRVRGGDPETEGTATAEGMEAAGGERGGAVGTAEAEGEEMPVPTRRATPTLRPFGEALAAGDNPQVRVIYS